MDANFNHKISCSEKKNRNYSYVLRASESIVTRKKALFALPPIPGYVSTLIKP